MVWYPDFEDLKFNNNLMIDLFGGHRGVRNNHNIFKIIIEEMKVMKGLYRQASVLMKELRYVNIFENGNKRTAYTTTKQFLEMNGEKMRITHLDRGLKFIKQIGRYNLDEIEEWLRHGSKRES